MRGFDGDEVRANAYCGYSHLECIILYVWLYFLLAVTLRPVKLIMTYTLASS